MKKFNIIILTVLFTSLAFLTSCENEEKTFFQGDQALKFNGAYLLQLDFPGNSLSIADLANSNFEVTFEAHDYTSDSSLLGSVDVLVTYDQNPDVEVALTTIDASAFVEGDKGYPVHTFVSPANDAITALSLDSTALAAGQKITYRFVLNLTDGTSWTVGQIGSSTVVELNFISPYTWDASFVN